MTVMENLQLGAHVKPRGAIGALVDRRVRPVPRLAERRSQLAGSMSGGEQQMLAIARGLMAEPKLIILDEPSLGLMPTVTQEMFRLIEAVNKGGIGVLLVEQNLHQSLRIAHRGYVLEKGEVVLAGTGQELLSNDYVRRAFLGPLDAPQRCSRAPSQATPGRAPRYAAITRGSFETTCRAGRRRSSSRRRAPAGGRRLPSPRACRARPVRR